MTSAFLLFFRLGELSVWEDEAMVVYKSLLQLYAIVDYQNNLLFNLILSGWNHFGKDEFWLRIPSALFALFTLVALYALGKKLFSARVAVLACLLLTTSPFFLLESRQIKMYSLVIFFSLASVYFLILFFETGRRGHLLSHLGLSWMALMTHYMFLLLVPVLFLLIFSRSREFPRGRLKQYLTALFFVGLLLTPFLPQFFAKLKSHIWFYLSPTSPESLSFPFGYFGKMGFIYYLFAVGPTLFPWKFLWVIPGCLLPAYLLLYSLKSASESPFKLCLLGLGIPVLLLSGFRNIQPHHALVSLPFYTLLLAAALTRLRPLVGTCVLSGLILVNGYGLANYFMGQQYLFITYLAPYREIVTFVKNRFLPSDLILHSQKNLPFYYYFYWREPGRADTLDLHYTKEHEPTIVRLRTWEELESILHNPPLTERLWFIERPPGQFIDSMLPLLNAKQIYEENLAFRKSLDRRFKRLGRWVYLKDPDIQNKERFLQKFYMEERIVVSLYDLTTSP